MKEKEKKKGKHERPMENKFRYRSFEKQKKGIIKKKKKVKRKNVKKKKIIRRRQLVHVPGFPIYRS